MAGLGDLSERHAASAERLRARQYGTAVAATEAQTKLGIWRVRRGLTQDDMARAIGVSLNTYRRLERGAYRNPGVRYLANCALALGCELEELLEDEWRSWFVFDRRAPDPPEPERFWAETE